MTLVRDTKSFLMSVLESAEEMLFLLFLSHFTISMMTVGDEKVN